MASASAPESVWFLDGLMRIHVSAGNGGRDISLIEHTAPYLSSPPVHAHRDEDEIFYLLDGEVRFVVEGRPVTAVAGQSVVAPRGKPHSFQVTSRNGARWLVITCGRNFERLVRAIGRPAGTDDLPPVAAPTAAEAEALGAACRASGIDILGPPLAAATDVA